MYLNSSPHRCGDDPVPGDASVSLPGFALPVGDELADDFTGKEFGTNMKNE